MLTEQSRPRLFRLAVLQLLPVILLLMPLVLVSPEAGAQSRYEPPVSLSREEQRWLDQRAGTVRVGIAFIPPHTLEQDNSGRYHGVAMDFMALLEQKLPLHFAPKFYNSYSALLSAARVGEVDMVFAASQTPEREKFLLFTQPYTFLANKIFVRKMSPHYRSLDELTGRTVAVIRDTAMAEYLKTYYPQIHTLELRSAGDLMLALSAGNADAAVSVVASAWWYIRREGLSNLDVSGDASYSYAVRFATRRDLPQLAGILEKGLYQITDSERERIHRRWLHPELEGAFDRGQVLAYVYGLGGVLLLGLMLAGLLVIRHLRREVAQRQQVEQALRQSEQRFDLAIRGTNDGIWDWDLQSNELYLAPRFLQILGARDGDNGRVEQGSEAWIQRVHPADQQRVQNALEQHLHHHQPLDLCYRMRNEHNSWLWLRMRGQAYWAEDGRPLRVCGSIMDITESKRSEDEVRRLAYFDQLTGIANRERFKIGLQQAVDKLNSRQCPFAVLFLDIDNFKQINDTLGHTIGDRVLVHTAGLMAQLLPPSSFISRLGGDEFAVLLEMPADEQEVAYWAGELLEQLAKPVHLQGHELKTSLTIGISYWQQGPASIEKVMEQADIALFEAKREQPGRFCFHRLSMSQKIAERTRLAKDLEQALQQNQLFLLYQPQINLSREQVIGCEALVRWQHPEQGVISPAMFIPLAEECGLIHQLGDWVLQQACTQARKWQDQAVAFGAVGVNISALQLLAGGFVDRVEEILKQTGLPPDRLELEITETVLVQDIQLAEQTMQQLRALGVRFSIDDFGTGYSSLLYLQRLPISRLKLAQEFVRDLDPQQQGNNQGTAVVAAALHLGQQLQIPVIAEGIERYEQFSWLRQLGCEEGQGYLFARPLSAEVFADYVQRSNTEGVLPLTDPSLKEQDLMRSS